MLIEDGYDVRGFAWFQYDKDGDEQNGSKSNVPLVLMCFAGEAKKMETLRDEWDKTMER